MLRQISRYAIQEVATVRIPHLEGMYADIYPWSRPEAVRARDEAIRSTESAEAMRQGVAAAAAGAKRVRVEIDGKTHLRAEAKARRAVLSLVKNMHPWVDADDTEREYSPSLGDELLQVTWQASGADVEASLAGFVGEDDVLGEILVARQWARLPDDDDESPDYKDIEAEDVRWDVMSVGQLTSLFIGCVARRLDRACNGASDSDAEALRPTSGGDSTSTDEPTTKNESSSTTSSSEPARSVGSTGKKGKARASTASD